jgi:hypothetical protein
MIQNTGLNWTKMIGAMVVSGAGVMVALPDWSALLEIQGVAAMLMAVGSVLYSGKAVEPS